ncbi:unnamed protein product [Penicillium olsonii]|uniref:NADH:flavin oxidoreductase/NADH oxidase N-terminal domain-containing protein n=1 Tax=Penicillium olsonii TaxID=99116 RepID=A0A9W4MQG2_PENOL|nr:unnamed protein product [Penicillium olsonii]
MAIQDLFKPLAMKRGPTLKNRLLLAPLTNWQSDDQNGIASEYDLNWITNCAAGGHSMVMTCASHVHQFGKTFPGQLGVYSDAHIEGLRSIADIIRSHGGISSIQIQHGGARVQPARGGTPVGPSCLPEYHARGLTLDEIHNLRQDFVAAAKRAETAGFDGVEVHGAFGWILMQFLSPRFNKRTDHYGGSFENRSRLLFEVIDDIRAACRPDFQIGLRLSLETRYEIKLSEFQQVAARAFKEEAIDFLDLALGDYRNIAQEAPFEGETVLSIFTALPRGAVCLGASGHIFSASDAAFVLEAGCDFAMVGRAAILDPNFPNNVQKHPMYSAPSLPVSESDLRQTGLSERFITYMRTWRGFIAQDME